MFGIEPRKICRIGCRDSLEPRPSSLRSECSTFTKVEHSDRSDEGLGSRLGVGKPLKFPEQSSSIATSRVGSIKRGKGLVRGYRWLCTATTATALVRCREENSKKTDMCWYKRGFLNFFFCQSRRAFLKALLLCLFGGERQGSVVRPFPASSPLSIVKIDVSEISRPPTRLPHPEKWQPWSLKMLSNKKYFERPHTAVFRRQRLGTTPSTRIFRQDDRFGAKRRRLLLWSVREHLIRVVQRPAFVSTDKLWLSRLSFFGMDYSSP